MYILAVDQSTSSTKAILFDQELRLVGRSNQEHRQIYPQAGWVEHDPLEIYENLKTAVAKVLEKTGVSPKDIQCLSLSNQRETTLIWDADTGLPVYNAIVWQCGRAAGITGRPEMQQRKTEVAQKTGLTLSPYFCAAKAAWIVENVDLRGKRPLFGTVDAWLVWKLTGNHLTDYTNASRTQLFNLHTLTWDDELISLFGLQGVAFPEVIDSNGFFGETTLDGLFDRPIPLVGVLGDSHGAMLGQQCWQSGMGKATFGTGTSVMMNIGEKPLLSNRGVATSIAWGLNGRVEYVFEGNINCTGDTLSWLKNNLGILPDAKSSEAYARGVPGSQGVYLVPAFTGLGAPYYDSGARALICGLFRDAGKEHIVRAALEAIAYQVRDVVDPMVQDANRRFEELRVDGGPTGNAFLMQFVADMLDTRIVRADIEELSALGAACAGGLGTGMFGGLDELAKLRRTKEEYVPRMSRDEADALYSGWKKAVARARESQF
ncbi:MAG: glycerol kinase GlpK [Eubacteriales bacterium]|nr:glycerol kinase GlpK [Eubacteriales bacterium]